MKIEDVFAGKNRTAVWAVVKVALLLLSISIFGYYHGRDILEMVTGPLRPIGD